MSDQNVGTLADVPTFESAAMAALRDPKAALLALDKFESERSLRGFIRRAWHILEPPSRPFVDGWAVGAICEHLEAVSRGELRRLLINVPPGFMKSLTTDVFWPSWVWGPQNRPDRRFISWSYAEQLTIRDNRKTRQVVLSEWYRTLWGDRFKLVHDQNQRVRFENDKTGWKLATSVSGLGTGERGDILVIDDPHNVKEGESDAKRKEVLLWFTEVIPTRVNDPEKSAIVVIMQRVHNDDVSALIVEEELGYEHLVLPMEFERERRCFTTVPGRSPAQAMRYLPRRQVWLPEGWTPQTDEDKQLLPDYRKATARQVYCWDHRVTDGELLWPERFTPGALEDLKKALMAEGGSYAVAGQLQQRPVARSGGMFQRAWFTRFVTERPPASARRVRYWDKAGTEGGGAYSAGVLMSEWEGQYYIEDVIRGQWSSANRNAIILQTARTDAQRGYVDIWVEQEPGSGGKESAEITIKELAGFNVQREPVTGDKETRAKPFAAQAEVGLVVLVEAPWNADFIDEICTFPNSKFKDQTDACCGAFNKLKLSNTQVIAAVMPKNPAWQRRFYGRPL